jgi:ketosteroid isomerase-like protein
MHGSCRSTDDRRARHEKGIPVMASDNEQIIRRAYRALEEKDLEGWVNCFTPDGTFTDESIGVTYLGPKELAFTVENYGRAFPDMHRELFQFYVAGSIVVVQLALQGTHLGPLNLPGGVIPPTGKRMDAPCADVFELQDGKIKRFDSYPSGTVVMTQLGVLENLSAHIARATVFVGSLFDAEAEQRGDGYSQRAGSLLHRGPNDPQRRPLPEVSHVGR